MPASSPDRPAADRPVAGRPLRVMRALGHIVRRVIGVPDYDRYVAHVRAHHPGMEPMTAQEFARERMESRYSKPGSRCC